jgi:hypothetical protein
MGLTCRLLGHVYGEPELEREREEKGDEVVVTIRELQVCERCGAEHLVSENKEVTSIRTLSEVGLDEPPVASSPETPGADASAADAPSVRTGSNAETGASADGDAASHIPEAEPDAAVGDAEVAADAEEEEFEPRDPEEDDAIILGDDEDERDPTQWPEETDADPAAAAAEDPPGNVPRDADGEPVTDDAELIDADAASESEPERGHGEWPAHETAADEGGVDAPWPEHTAEDEGFDAEPSDGSPADVSFGGGLAPETNGHAASLGRSDGIVSATNDGFARAENRAELEADVPDDRVEFYCPNCDHARTAGASSMRAGDICPECRKGYIAERQL